MRKLLPLLALVLGIAPAAVAEGRLPDSDFRALHGADAQAFVVPPDMHLVRRLSLAGGVTYQRFQQIHRGASVVGGQISVVLAADGHPLSVTGAHYANVAGRNSVQIGRSEAARTARRDVGWASRRSISLRIDPATGRYFYQVESVQLGSRWVHWIDAANGRILRRIDALAKAHGTGVKGDTKDMNGPNNSSTTDDLTKYHSRAGHGRKGAHWDLFSKDNRQRTYTAKNTTTTAYYATDADNHWTSVTSNRRSPGQPAMVDAQFYANATDDYFQKRLGLNWQSCYPRMESVVHLGINVNNAAWDGQEVVFGDGDGVDYREFSGALDVVAHEWTHGLTQCTSNLMYSGESGALNEAFSDILGASAEYFTAEPVKSKCVLASGQAACRDWWMGEDIVLASDTVPGDRNLADPAEDGLPDHYDERYTGPEDNGGVHRNMSIPSHAYYLLVGGGQNAGCDAVGSDGHTHTADCDVTVAGIGRTKAEKIFFWGFIGLTETASMCDARLSTEAEGEVLYGVGSAEAQATTAAWDAVGVPSSC